MLIESRKHLAFGGDYAFGFNGKMVDKEVKGEGNSLDFGARIYDPRLGMWMSVDPENKQYPHLAPYSSFGLNPIYYVDPGGETLRVAGDAKAREEARVALQKLTNDKVIVQRDGLVKIVAGNENPNKKLINGTQLIRDVSKHERTTEITIGGFESSQSNESDLNATNGVGSNGRILLGIERKVLIENSKTHKSEMETMDKSLILGTELIHALKGMDGKQRKDNWVEESFYKDENGKQQRELQRREELDTHGIGGAYNTKKDGSIYVNENDLRKEQGKGKRIAYDVDYDNSSSGKVYEKKK
jgi:RHS repeat-associated protein